MNPSFGVINYTVLIVYLLAVAVSFCFQLMRLWNRSCCGAATAIHRVFPVR